MLNQSIRKYQDRVASFAKERDWDKFHTIKNLSMALSVECSELMEHFQWDIEGSSLSVEKKGLVEDELIDIFIYWMRLADKMDLDIESVFERKFLENNEKYPADIVRGSSKKYTEY
ncbi:MAG: nucleotide pyrophosphohydrolase [Bacteriovoracaceae bacterium]|nr:nucleotide pyrophosphohydrolase [Bacteriovoracaceae bacterium]